MVMNLIAQSQVHCLEVVRFTSVGSFEDGQPDPDIPILKEAKSEYAQSQ